LSRSFDKRLFAALTMALIALPQLSTLAQAGVELWLPGGVPTVSTLDDRDHPAAAPDGAGGAFVAWYEGGMIRLQRMTAAGFTAPGWDPAAGRLVCDEPNYNGFMQTSPRSISDDQGGVFVLWCDQRNRSCTVGCLGDPSQLFVQHFTAAGGVSAGWPALGVDVGSALTPMRPAPVGWRWTPGELNPVLVPDGQHGLLVAWTEGTGLYSPPSPLPGVHAQRITSDGVKLWGDHGLVVCASPASVSAYPSISSDGSGGAFVAWEDARDASDGSRIFFQHVSSAGQPLLEANGRRLASVADVQERFVQIVALAGDGAMAVWEAGDSDQAHSLFGAFVGLDRKAPGSKRPAVAIESPIVDSAEPGGDFALIADESSGAWVSWIDVRDAAHKAPYFQRLRDDAGPLIGWPSGGVAGSDGSVPRASRPRLVEDGLGGAFVAWRDSTGSRASRVFRGALARGWPSSGVLLSNADSYDYSIDMISDAAHGAIVVWEQWMPAIGIDDLRAQRVSPFDAVPYVMPVGAPAVAPQPPPGGPMELKVQLAVRPNPAHGALRIEFSLPRPDPATIDVFDLVGRRVAHRDFAPGSGSGAVTLSDREPLRPGMYIVRLTQGDLRITRRAVIAR